MTRANGLRKDGMNMWQELQPGDPQVIGPYRIRGQLGVGGMGRVFLGVSEGGRPVAVKVVRADLAADPEFRTRFRREIAVARKVSSQFTAPVMDADVDGPAPWLATAFVAGPSLADAVSQHGPLPVRAVLELAAGLAEGLRAIHAAGIVHRDLKPSNVLLAPDGPRVIDFGISRAIESSALTHTGMVVGSPGFMSPEQAEGGEVGPPTDIFSLGAVLAYAATGEGPFGAGSTPALVYRVVHSPASLDRVPAEVRPLIERCLAKDPGQRPTARELLAETAAVEPVAGWLPEPMTQTFLQYPGLFGLSAAGAMPGYAPLPYGPLADGPQPDGLLPDGPAPAGSSASRAITAAPTAPPPPGPASGEHRRDHGRSRGGLRRPLAIAAIVAGLAAASTAGGVGLAAALSQSPGAQSGQHATSIQSDSPATYQPPTTYQSTSQPAAAPSTTAPADPPSTTAPATAPSSTPPSSPSTSAPAAPAPAPTPSPSYTYTPPAPAPTPSPSNTSSGYGY
jgi:eukaryotic-like serine/threonine-protein kinase